MITKNDTTIDDWYQTKDKLPCEPGGQADVIFCSKGWVCAIVGMYTRYTEAEQWSMYDQGNDRFMDWNIVPEMWMYMPHIPTDSKVKTLDQQVATIRNEEEPAWWNALPKSQRIYLINNQTAMKTQAFEAGVKAGILASLRKGV